MKNDKIYIHKGGSNVISLTSGTTTYEKYIDIIHIQQCKLSTLDAITRYNPYYHPYSVKLKLGSSNDIYLRSGTTKIQL